MKRRGDDPGEVWLRGSEEMNRVEWELRAALAKRLACTLAAGKRLSEVVGQQPTATGTVFCAARGRTV
jgi:hypothetical protein